MVNKKKIPALAGDKTCTGCLACINICSQSAITKKLYSDGHVYVEVDTNTCIGCLKCQKICDSIHNGEYSSNDKSSLPFSVYTNIVEDYNNATSGGVFPAIARHFLNKGGVVYGAAYSNGFKVNHIGIESEADLKKLQGSKYIQSDLQDIYHSIASNLKRGRNVLFSGTGCQVAAVLAYFEKDKNKDLLYTMDLVCGGVPSSLLIKAFVKNSKPKAHSIACFRNKEKYQFAYYTDDGALIKVNKSLPLDGFKSSLTNRYSCYNCEFTGIHRASDWTIGDLWGDSDKTKCKSLCICHNDRATEILKSVNTSISELPDWRFAIHNPRLINGRCGFENRFERKYIGWIFNHISYTTLCKIYAADVKKYDIFWMLYKVYRYIRFMNYYKNSKTIATKIIS